jgi:serine/threonine protein phosphatase PrpC
MEDVHRVLPVLADDLQQYSYFGVYDGHGGRQIVDFLEEALEKNIMNELRMQDDAPILDRLSRYCRFLIQLLSLAGVNIRSSYFFFLFFLKKQHQQLKYYEHRAFLITDMQSRRDDIVASGATAVSVLLKRSEDGSSRSVYVANVGDSRAVLVTSKPPDRYVHDN